MRIQAFLTATAYNVRKRAVSKRIKRESGVEAQENGEVVEMSHSAFSDFDID